MTSHALSGTQEATMTDRPQLQRLGSLDAYRGIVMFLMMAEVLHLGRMAGAFPESVVWGFLGFHQSHVAWIGCSLHDLIQPSFSFMVGVALPFSLASRLSKGQSPGQMARHAWIRALILISLGIFLRSVHASQTRFTFEDTLTQIGLGYGVLFWLGQRSTRTQWIALSVILVGSWVAFALYPLPCAGFRAYHRKRMERGICHGCPCRRAWRPAFADAPSLAEASFAEARAKLPLRRSVSEASRLRAGRRRGPRTVGMATSSSPRTRVTPKRNRKADPAAFMEVAEAPINLICS